MRCSVSSRLSNVSPSLRLAPIVVSGGGGESTQIMLRMNAPAIPPPFLQGSQGIAGRTFRHCYLLIRAGTSTVFQVGIFISLGY